MEEFCVGCQKRHKGFDWVFRNYKVNGKTKIGWFCKDYFTPIKLEWLPDRVKEDRIKHAKDTVQPWRGGKPSREFCKLYPNKAKKTFTKKEIRGARDCWRDTKGLKDIQETR